MAHLPHVAQCGRRGSPPGAPKLATTALVGRPRPTATIPNAPTFSKPRQQPPNNITMSGKGAKGLSGKVRLSTTRPTRSCALLTHLPVLCDLAGCQGHHGRQVQVRQEEAHLAVRQGRPAVPRGPYPPSAQGAWGLYKPLRGPAGCGAAGMRAAGVQQAARVDPPRPAARPPRRLSRPATQSEDCRQVHAVAGRPRERVRLCPPSTTLGRPGPSFPRLRSRPSSARSSQSRVTANGRVGATAAVYTAAILGGWSMPRASGFNTLPLGLNRLSLCPLHPAPSPRDAWWRACCGPWGCMLGSARVGPV